MADHTLTAAEAEKEFWKALEKSNTGMLGLDQPGHHARPMTAFREDETGTIWFFTLGLLGVGWLVDAFLIPSMDREADRRFVEGPYDYSVAWLLLTFLGLFGAHRFYQGKWVSGVVYLLSGGFFLLGVYWDFLTLNTQISERNATSGTSR